MRLLVAFFAITAIILSSCQKEVDSVIDNSRTGSTASDVLLVKTVQKTASDSLVTTYSYNSAKKIINMKIVGTDQGAPKNTEYRYYRNASGIVTHYSIIDIDLIGSGIDSLIVNVHYNSSSSRYTSYVLNLNMAGFILLDSSNFVYDASGRIVGESLYESPSGSGNDYYLSGTTVYTYASGNIGQLDIHDLDQSGAETFSASTSNILYDSKINPIQTGNEGFALGHPEWASLNNIISEKLSDSNGSVDDETVATTYTYNSGNRPATSSATELPDNIVVTTSYFYQ